MKKEDILYIYALAEIALKNKKIQEKALRLIVKKTQDLPKSAKAFLIPRIKSSGVNSFSMIFFTCFIIDPKQRFNRSSSFQQFGQSFISRTNSVFLPVISPLIYSFAIPHFRKFCQLLKSQTGLGHNRFYIHFPVVHIGKIDISPKKEKKVSKKVKKRLDFFK